jgi:predicted porin
LGLEAAGVASPLGTGVGSGYAAVSGTMMNSVVQTRYNRSVRYDSPVMAGFTAAIQYAPGNDEVAVDAVAVATQIPNARKTTELGLKYANGPLNVSLVNIKQAAQTNKTGYYSGTQVALAETSATILGANYKMADTTVYFGYNTGDRLAVGVATTGAAAQSKGTRMAIKQTIGQFDVMAQQTTQDVTGVSTAADVKSTVTGLRADYNLSKTAATYIGYEKWDTKMAIDAAKGTGGDRKIVSIGLRKSF